MRFAPEFQPAMVNAIGSRERLPHPDLNLPRTLLSHSASRCELQPGARYILDDGRTFHSGLGRSFNSSSSSRTNGVGPHISQDDFWNSLPRPELLKCFDTVGGGLSISRTVLSARLPQSLRRWRSSEAYSGSVSRFTGTRRKAPLPSDESHSPSLFPNSRPPFLVVDGAESKPSTIRVRRQDAFLRRQGHVGSHDAAVPQTAHFHCGILPRRFRRGTDAPTNRYQYVHIRRFVPYQLTSCRATRQVSDMALYVNWRFVPRSRRSAIQTERAVIGPPRHTYRRCHRVPEVLSG